MTTPPPSPWRRLPLVIAVATTTVVAIGLAPAANADAQTPAPSRCSLTVPVNPRAEAPASCLRATVSLDRLPALGSTATVHVKIDSQVALSRAAVSVRVTEGLELITDGSSLGATRADGSWSKAGGALPLPAGSRTVTFQVRARAAGPAQVEADVSDATSPSPERSAFDSTQLTVGKNSSRAGADFTSLPGKATASRGVGNPKTKPAPSPAKTKYQVALAPANQICVNGGFQYTDNNVNRTVANATIKIHGKRYWNSSYELLAIGQTGANGGYDICFVPPVNPMYALQVEHGTTNSVWEVRNSSNYYYASWSQERFTTYTGTDWAAGYYTSTAAQQRAWHAFDTINQFYSVRNSPNGCWTRHEANCTRIYIRWWSGNTDGGYYVPGADAYASYIQLRDNDPDSEHLVLHETGHAFHHRLYNFWWPGPNCAGHQIHVESSVGCAWTEGLANAFAGYIKGDDRFVWPEGSWISLMNTTWFNSAYWVSTTNWNNGDATEGRVAGSLIDLWRNVDGGMNSTINLLSYYTQSTFFEYFNERGYQDLDLTSTSRNRLYSHTIDYRQVLGNNGFESGAATWSWTAPGTDNVIGTWGTYPARTGSWYAWLGGYGYDTTTSLSQGAGTPAAPSGKPGKVQVSFWSRIWSEEAVGDPAYDILQVQVVDGATVTAVGSLSNVDRSNGYVFRTYDLSAWRGRAVTLRFMADEDASLRTDFIIDDVQVTYNQN